MRAKAEGTKSLRLRYDGATGRRERILHAVGQTGSVTTTELAEMFQVSEMTIRRDFRRLADQGVVRLVHGGLSAVTTISGPIDFRLRAAQHGDAKRAIARSAISLLQPGSVVGLDAGTTTLEVARQLPDDTRLTIVTNSLPAMAAMAGRSSIEVLGLGGHFLASTQAFAGPMTVNDIRHVRIHTLLLAITAINGPTLWCTNPFDAETKRALISAADRVVLLADSSKFRTSAVMRVAEIDVIQTVVTDGAIDKQTLRRLRKSGLEVIVVEVRPLGT